MGHWIFPENLGQNPDLTLLKRSEIELGCR